jgi:hypothetical protein
MIRPFLLSFAAVTVLSALASSPAGADQATTWTAIALAESGGRTSAHSRPSANLRPWTVTHAGNQQSGRPSSAHVAISLGDGRTIEAKGGNYGVGAWGKQSVGTPKWAGSTPQLNRLVMPARLITPRVSLPQIGARLR